MSTAIFEAALIREVAGASSHLSLGLVDAGLSSGVHAADTALRRHPRILTPFPGAAWATADTAAVAVATTSSS